MHTHIPYMQRALDLAAFGLGKVSPNPLVGCVLVHNEKIIGEGWHQQYGAPHAEVNAIQSVNNPDLLAKSTLYVNLEPCSHHGKTPPCADQIISSEIKKVVIANKDPNPLVAGQGVARLRAAGIAVVEGVLEEAGSHLNRRFFTFHIQKRPFIILKWAETADGFIARLNYDSKWISNERSRQLVHQYRAHEDAIMVGRNTAQHDNPALTVRQWEGNNPLRIVLDPSLKLNRNLKLYDGTVPTICYNHEKNESGSNVEFVKVPKDDLLDFILGDLYQRDIQGVIIEGGAKLLGSLLQGGNWDEARVFTSSNKFEEGIKAPNISVPPEDERMIGEDTLRIYRKDGQAPNDQLPMR